MVTETIALEVRTLLVRRSIKTTSLADVVGLTPQALRRRLNGQTPFTVEEVASIAKVLDVSVAQLFGERDSWLEALS